MEIAGWFDTRQCDCYKIPLPNGPVGCERKGLTNKADLIDWIVLRSAVAPERGLIAS
jgi:hypothetical protein